MAEEEKDPDHLYIRAPFEGHHDLQRRTVNQKAMFSIEMNVKKGIYECCSVMVNQATADEQPIENPSRLFEFKKFSTKPVSAPLPIRIEVRLLFFSP